MKIMTITFSMYGGMIHYISQFTDALSKKEDVVIIAPFGVERKNFTKNVKIIELPLGHTIKTFFINTLIFTRPLKFLNTIHKEKPDIIHFNECHLWSSLFLPFLTKIPIITTIHDVKPHIGSRKYDQIIAQRIHAKFSDCLFVHGEKARKELKIHKKCFVIPHGDYSFFLKYSCKEINEEKDTILFFGRIEDYKGLEYLIRSIAIILINFPDIKLIIAGTGDFRKYTNMIFDNKHFEVHNRYIAEEEIPVFFNRAKIIILPYIEATQSGIVPIAYAFKKPVVVTDVGSIPEVVDDGKTGFIIPPKDSELLAEAIIKLLKNDKLRKEMGENAYNKMKEELSWDKIAEKTIEVYKDVIKDKTCKSSTRSN
jgi:alpha-maltose-1-phosphate synthase